jgi:hypothetical protein
MVVITYHNPAYAVLKRGVNLFFQGSSIPFLKTDICKNKYIRSYKSVLHNHVRRDIYLMLKCYKHMRGWL